MKTAKRILAATIVSAPLSGVIYLTLFTIVDLPADAFPDFRSALVLKHYRATHLEPGDCVWVKLEHASTSSNVVRRLSKIQSPNPAQAPRNRRPLARQILEMDHRPTYIVSADGFETNNLVAVAEDQIKGKAIHLFSRTAQ